MSWRDETAVKVITQTKRMDLLRVPIQEDADMLVEYLRANSYLTDSEIEDVYHGRTNSARMKIVIERLASRMTTAIFFDFINAIGDREMSNLPDLRDELTRCYNQLRGPTHQLSVQEENEEHLRGQEETRNP